MKPKISIIVPVYNVEKYIDDCVKSILTQKFEDFELILINDGSSDNSGKICDRYKLIDKRIKVLHKENNGASSARNLGIEIAIGEYIAFVDSDDKIDKCMYQKMYDLAIKEQCDLVVCGYKESNYITNEVNNYIDPLNGFYKLEKNKIKYILEEMLSRNKMIGYSSLCNKLYKSEIIIKNKFRINEKMKIAEDLCFNINVMLNINKVCALNEPLYEYRRINTNSIMNNNKNLYLKFDSRERMLNFFYESGISETVFKKCLKYESSITVISYIGLIKDIIVCNKNFKEKKIMIDNLINERYFKNSIINVDYKYFTLKLKIIAIVIKAYVKLDRKWRRI